MNDDVSSTIYSAVIDALVQIAIFFALGAVVAFVNALNSGAIVRKTAQFKQMISAPTTSVAEQLSVLQARAAQLKEASVLKDVSYLTFFGVGGPRRRQLQVEAAAPTSAHGGEACEAPAELVSTHPEGQV